MIGELLAEVRKDHGDTQKDLAQKLHVTVSTVRSWEQERSAPSHETLVSICRMYRVSADYLLGLSATDPAYVQRHRQAHFTGEEQEQLREFARFLLWKRRQPPQDPS